MCRKQAISLFPSGTLFSRFFFFAKSSTSSASSMTQTACPGEGKSDVQKEMATISSFASLDSAIRANECQVL